MTGADWPRVRAAFEQASELPPAEQRTFLDRDVGIDTAERREVERLLGAHRSSADFLRPPAAATLASGLGAAAPVHERLGPFRIGRELARGGMGTVYVAEQDQPARTVAVKVLHGNLAVPRVRSRFEAEVSMLARLQHPGIAQVFEAGVEPDGTAWFAMELLAAALPVTQFAVQRQFVLTDRLALFLQVAAAVQHAHQRGVIHRDLKPANILVLPDGAAKVIDFGIARVLDPDRTAHTLAGELLGTLAYMSPEQVEGRETDVRTDVYGLGVVLHELVTGQQPFALGELSLTRACRCIVEQPPPLASQQAPGVPRELDWILQQALRKEPDARYPSVQEFAADVQRLLRHEPVAAGPTTVAYRVRKWVRRNRVGAVAAASVLLVSVVAFVMVTAALWRTQRAEAAERDGRTAAEAAAERAERAELAERDGRQVAEAAAARAAASLEFLLDVFSSVDPGKDGREVKMADALARAARDFGSRFAAEPSIRAALAEAIGKTYFGLGLFAEATTYLQDSVAVHEQNHGPDSREAGQARVALAYVQLRTGKLAEAEELLTRAAAAAARHDDELLSLSVAMRRADLLRAQGKKADAVALLRPTVERLRVRRGKHHRDTWAALTLLAGLLHEQGDLDGAEPLYQEALAAMTTWKGDDHPDTMTARSNYAMFQFSRGRRAEAVPMLEAVLTARRRVLGDTHSDTIGTVCNLGGVQFGLKQYEGAARHFALAIELLGPKVGDKNPMFQALLANLATAERELGHFPRSIELGEQVLALRRRDLGASHDTTLTTGNMLADAYRQAGETERALGMFEECRRLALAALPPAVVNVYRSELGMGRCQVALRRFEVAEALFLHLVETFAASERAASSKGQLSHPDADFVALYDAWGRPELAAQFRAKLPTATPRSQH